MRRFELTPILIMAQHPDVSRRWAQILAQATPNVSIGKEEAHAIFLSHGAIPAGQLLDVVVTDRPASEVLPLLATGQAPEEWLASPARPATITLPPADWGDVSLQTGWRDEELRLACRLLGENARLRRRQQHVETEHRHALQLADTDPLTGVANRRAWDRWLQSFGAPPRETVVTKPDSAAATTPTNVAGFSHRGNGSNVWLALLDLDRFKAINDRAGMAFGDDTLRHVAQVLRQQLRRADLVARLGGDEFGILLRADSQANAGAVLERLRTAIHGIQLLPSLNGLSASIGFSGCAQEGTTAETLFAAAEAALRLAKHAGGDQVRFAATA